MQYLVRFSQAVLLLGLVTAFYAQNDVGYADNGDYTRAMTRFVTGPVGFARNWPDPIYEPKEFSQRFFSYWIPYWNLNPHGIDLSPEGAAFNSSAVALWLPGVLLNYSLYSSTVLYLPYLSVLPKLLLIAALWLIFLWLDHTESIGSWRAKLLLSITLGLPFVLIVSATDYVAYFSTFFFETASFVFAILFLISLVVLDRAAPRFFKWAIALCLILLFLLASAKLSTVYWPLVGMPFVFYLLKAGRGKFQAFILAVVAVSFCLGAIWLDKEPPPGLSHNAMDRFFYGVLTFSDNAPARLSELGIPETIPCIDILSQTPEGIRCMTEYGDQASFQNVLAVVVKEPAIVVRMMVHSAESAQQVAVRWGKRAMDAPVRTVPQLLNVWGLIRDRLFPRGLALLGVLGAYAALFALNIRSNDLRRGLSIAGLVSVIGSWVDMQVAIWGNGKADLPRHLFLANALFDFATICAVNLIVVYVIDRARRRRGLAPAQA